MPLARHEFLLLYTYLPQARELLLKHELTVPEITAEMVAKTIMKFREPKSKLEEGVKGLLTRQRLDRARGHAIKLMEYADRRPHHASSIPARSKSLRHLLNNLDVAIWLAIDAPSIDVPRLMTELEVSENERELPASIKIIQKLQSDLARLVEALNFILAQKQERTGRPIEQETLVIRAACIAWHRAGRDRTYGWDGFNERLTGPLPEFLAGLLSMCGLSMKDAALHSALKVAIPFVKKGMLRAAAPT